MQVFPAQKTDLISPFPVQEIPRLRKWMYCYKSLILDDSIATSEDELLEFLHQFVQRPNVISWGVIDRDNVTGYRHEAPLIGYVSFEQFSPFNGYLHIASARSAWGKGLMDDAAAEVIKLLFENSPYLLRLSCAILAKNGPAKALAYRMGFKKEGSFASFVLQNGQPQDVLHFGLTREQYEASKQIETATPSEVVDPQPALVEEPING